MNTKRSDKKRVGMLDAMNLLFTAAVLLIHISSRAVSKLPVSSPFYLPVYIPWRLSFAAIQGFIFVGGVKLSLTYKTEKFTYFRYIHGRLRKVLLPYTAVCAVYAVRSLIGGASAASIITAFITGGFDAHLYFVPLIFSFYLLAPLWLKLTEKIPAVIAIPIAFAFMLVYGTVVLPFIKSLGAGDDIYNIIAHLLPAYIGFWIAGMYSGNNINALTDFIKKYRMTFLIFGASALIIYGALFTLDVYGIIDVNNAFFPHSVYVAAILPALIYLTTSENKKLPCIFGSTIFKLINTSTYYIYLWHCLLITATDAVLTKLGIIGALDSHIIKLLAVPITIIALSVLYTVLKNQIKKRVLRNHEK